MKACDLDLYLGHDHGRRMADLLREADTGLAEAMRALRLAPPGIPSHSYEHRHYVVARIADALCAWDVLVTYLGGQEADDWSRRLLNFRAGSVPLLIGARDDLLKNWFTHGSDLQGCVAKVVHMIEAARAGFDGAIMLLAGGYEPA
jgi:hypothetical protein